MIACDCSITIVFPPALITIREGAQEFRCVNCGKIITVHYATSDIKAEAS